MHDTLASPQLPPPRSLFPPFLPADEVADALRQLELPLYAMRHENRVYLTRDAPPAERLAGVIPAVRPGDLGSRAFRQAHKLSWAYVTGAMAGGIASVDLVVAMAKAGGLGFFGSGGLPLAQVEAALLEIKRRLPLGEPFGMNLLHNHYEPQVELETVELYLRHGVRRIEAAAFMDLTPAVVLFRAKGATRVSDGRVFAPNRVVAKVSRAEVAARFMAPAPDAMLRELVAAGKLTPDEAALAAEIPVAEDITAEADSGGHTDGRPLTVLVPLMLQEREHAMARHGYASRGVSLRIGAGGGIGTPQAALAALSLGADYLITGSINHASVQAGTSEAVRRMLCEADMADVASAPAPDMFELGAKVQVLKRGTLYAQRSQRLHEIWRAHARFEDLPAAERDKVERTILRRPFDEVWAETERYWSQRDPAQVEKARADGRFKMALCFRWYLGMSSRWARTGEVERQADYQIWCGPAMGAFNRWVRDTPLAPPEARDAAAMAEALLRATSALARREVAVRLGVDELPGTWEVGRPA